MDGGSSCGRAFLCRAGQGLLASAPQGSGDCWFPRAALTKDHKRGGFKQAHLTLSQLWRLEVPRPAAIRLVAPASSEAAPTQASLQPGVLLVTLCSLACRSSLCSLACRSTLCYPPPVLRGLLCVSLCPFLRHFFGFKNHPNLHCPHLGPQLGTSGKTLNLDRATLGPSGQTPLGSVHASQTQAFPHTVWFRACGAKPGPQDFPKALQVIWTRGHGWEAGLGLGKLKESLT